MSLKGLFIAIGCIVHIAITTLAIYFGVFYYGMETTEGAVITIFLQMVGQFAFAISYWTFMLDHDWFERDNDMGIIENNEDGTSIDHSQYGDYHYDENGNLREFRPISKLNYLIQQIGIQRVIEMVGYDIVDEFGNYKVINLDLGRQRRLYLRMVNPSTKEIHYEGVPNECDSVERALKWRNQSNELPMELT